MSKTPKNVNILTHIYVLCDQENNIRYVGKTVASLKKRLQQHISEAKRHPNKNHRINWINSVLNSGYYVNIQEIDSCPWCNSQKLEQYYIKYYIENGFNLVNSTKGGEGNLGLKKSKECIIKLKNSLRKNSSPVYQYDFYGNYIQSFSCPSEAAETLNVNYFSICRCLRKERQSYKSFRFLSHYEQCPNVVVNLTNFNNKKVRHNKKAKPVIQLDLYGNFLNRFESAWKACQELNVSTNNASNITTVCKGKKKTVLGFKWKYEE